MLFPTVHADEHHGYEFDLFCLQVNAQSSESTASASNIATFLEQLQDVFETPCLCVVESFIVSRTWLHRLSFSLFFGALSSHFLE
jgi:hypothetical protein